MVEDTSRLFVGSSSVIFGCSFSKYGTTISVITILRSGVKNNGSLLCAKYMFFEMISIHGIPGSKDSTL
jgi:hypothetical protein